MPGRGVPCCYQGTTSLNETARGGTGNLASKEQEAREQAEAPAGPKTNSWQWSTHELRAPLNAMLGWAQILRSTKLTRAR